MQWQIGVYSTGMRGPAVNFHGTTHNQTQFHSTGVATPSNNKLCNKLKGSLLMQLKLLSYQITL